MSQQREIIGLLPAGGLGSRLGPLPMSKEIFPVGFENVATEQPPRVKVVSDYLLASMQFAGIEKAYVILRSGKWDIPSYFGDGSRIRMHLAYLLMGIPHGTPYTLDQARPFVEHARVALGFPDIVFEPTDAFVHLNNRQTETGADVVLGLFPTDTPQKMDMVRVDPSGRVLEIQIKPNRTDLQFTWILALWTPRFTQFMHEFLQRTLKTKDVPLTELYVGDVVRASMSAGLTVESVAFPKGRCSDIGTPAHLQQMIRSGSKKPG